LFLPSRRSQPHITQNTAATPTDIVPFLIHQLSFAQTGLPALLPRPPPPDIPRGAKTINAWTTAATPPTPLPPETEKNEKAKEKNRSVERSRSETKKKRKRSRSVKERKIKTDCHLCVFLVVASDGDPTAVVGRQRRRSRP
jgi:hypothetical protein